MADYDADKSVEPTPHRRQQARQQGHVARSQDLVAAAVLLAGLATLLALGGGLAQFLGRYFTEQLGGKPWLSVDPAAAVATWHQTIRALAKYLLPVLGLTLLAAVAANFLQVGFLFLPQKVLPDFSRLDPLQGLGRIFSLANAGRLALGLVKIAVIAAVAGVCVYSERQTILGLTELAVPQIALYLASVLLWTSLKIAAALLVLAVLDYGFQRWKFERDLRMTPQELREELKGLEGNRQVIARRRQMQRQGAG